MLTPNIPVTVSSFAKFSIECPELEGTNMSNRCYQAIFLIFLKSGTYQFYEHFSVTVSNLMMPFLTCSRLLVKRQLEEMITGVYRQKYEKKTFIQCK